MIRMTTSGYEAFWCCFYLLGLSNLILVIYCLVFEQRFILSGRDLLIVCFFGLMPPWLEILYILDHPQLLPSQDFAPSALFVGWTCRRAVSSSGWAQSISTHIQSTLGSNCVMLYHIHTFSIDCFYDPVQLLCQITVISAGRTEQHSLTPWCIASLRMLYHGWRLGSHWRLS